MGLPEPTLVTGKVIPVVVPPSAALKRYVQSLAARADAVRSGRVDPTSDNVLRIVGDGRKAALDIRLVVPTAPRPRQSKIAALVAHVAQLHHIYAPLQGTQLIFCDLATPKGRREQDDRAPAVAEDDRPPTTDDREQDDRPPTTTASAPDRRDPSVVRRPSSVVVVDLETAEERWLSSFVYHEIRDGLVAQGVAREAVAFIQTTRPRPSATRSSRRSTPGACAS